MFSMLIKWILFALLIVFVAWIIPGISVSNFFSAMIASVVIGLINIFIRPLIEFISFPVTFLTLGLFSFVVNAFLLMLAGWIAPGFEVDGFWSAVLGSIVLAIFAGVINKITTKKTSEV